MAAIAATAAVSLPLVATGAGATQGDLVPSFGVDGRAAVDVGHEDEASPLADLEVTPTGGTVAVLERYAGEDTGYVRTIVRLLADGSPDPSFATVTPPPLPGPQHLEPARVAVDPSGRVVYATQTVVARYTTSGELDGSFAGDGTYSLSSIIPTADRVRDLTVLPDGRVTVLVDWIGAVGNAAPSLVQLTDDGVPDTSFSGDGRFDIPGSAAERRGADMERDASGDHYVSILNAATGGEVAKVGSTGTLVASYAGDGISESAGGFEIALDADGGVLGVVASGFDLYTTRLTPAGEPDASWGTGGTAVISTPESITDTAEVVILGAIAYVAATVSFQAAGVVALDLTTGEPSDAFDDDGLVEVGSALGTAATALTATGGGLRIAVSSSEDVSEVVQVTATGAIDVTFSTDGRAPVALRRHREGAVTAVAGGPDGTLGVAGMLDGGRSGAFVTLLDESGAVDPTFGDGGILVIEPGPDSFGEEEYVEPTAMVVLPDGRAAVVVMRRGEFSSVGHAFELWVVDTAGEPDDTFGGDGSVEVGGASGEVTALTTAGTGGDLHLYAGGVAEDGPQVALQKVGLDGATDAAYGSTDGSDDGWAAFPYWVEPPGDERFGLVLAGAADGTVAWGSATDGPGTGLDKGFAIGRYTSTGAVDTAFGVDGAREHLVGAGTFIDAALDLERRASGGVDLVARSGTSALTMRVTGTGALDAAYSGDGVSSLALPGSPETAVPILGAAQGDRAVFAYRPSGETATHLFRVSSSGVADSAFGPNGVRATGHVPRSSAAPPTTLTAIDEAVFVDDAVPASGPNEALGADPEIVKISTEPSAPGAPTGAAAVRGDASASVSWSPPTDDGGAPVTGYTVTATPGGATCTDTTAPLFCTVTGLTNGVPHTFTVTATNAGGTGPASAASNPVTPAAGAGSFQALPQPQRFADSRNPSGDTDDEQQERFGAMSAGATRAIPIAGRLGIPADADNAVLSVVAVNPTTAGHLTVWPCGTAKPSTSSLNYNGQITIANTVLSKLGTGGDDGKVCVYTSAKTDVIVDGAGSMSATAFTPLPTPQRMADSRNPSGDTDDEQQERFGAMGAGATRAIPIAGRLGIPADADNAVLSIVAVNPTTAGHLTIWPCGAPKPSTSNLNYSTGLTVANSVLSKLGAGGADDGKVCVFTSAKTDVIIDAAGTLAESSFLALANPQRMADSRNPSGDTDDEQQERFGAMSAGTTRAIPIAGRLGIPADADNAVLSIVAVNPTTAGHLTIWPCGTPKPSTSSLNYTTPHTVANTVLTPLGTTGADDGKVCVFTSAKTDVIIDAAGTLF